MDDLLASKVCGHTQAIRLLSKAVITQQPPQSLLISGLSQLGKTTLALAFAQALNCTAAQPPCEQCISCRKMAAHSHPDVLLHEDNGDPLKIEDIRSLQHNLSLRPHESRYKIAILSRFERATTSAANALLKMLEEPPAHVILILTAQKATRLLPTITSRCQVIQLKPIDTALIETTLQQRYQASIERSRLVSRLAAGRLGWAINALAAPDALEQRNQYLLDLTELLPQNEAYRLDYAQRTLQGNAMLDELFQQWLIWWRDVLLLHHHFSEGIVNIDWQEKLQTLAQQLATEQITTAIHHTSLALKNINYNVNTRLNLEVLLLNLPKL
jgi:DNA polymerase-3 subunit delta'